MPTARSIPVFAGLLLTTLLCGGSVLAQGDDDATSSVDTDASISSAVSIEDAWARLSSQADRVGEAYMRLVNGSETDDAVVAASSPAVSAIELHQGADSSEDGLMTTPVESIPVPAGGEALLAPGGYTLVLTDLAEPLQEGAVLDIRLEWQVAEPVTVAVEVMGPDATGPSSEGREATPGPAADLPSRITIEAYDNFYQPKVVEAPANSEVTVTLLNYGFLPHNVAFYTDPTASALLADGAVSAVIDPELEAKVTFTTPGPGEYFMLCVIHPEMTGTFIVR